MAACTGIRGYFRKVPQKVPKFRAGKQQQRETLFLFTWRTHVKSSTPESQIPNENRGSVKTLQST